MNKIILGTTITLSIFACNNKATDTTPPTSTATTANTTVVDTTKKASTSVIKTTTTIADEFRAFREAIYNKQKEEVANHFTFPITNAAQNLWMICEKEPKATMSRAEFITNFDKIFDSNFINSLLKVKSEELFSKGKHTTEAIISSRTSSYIDATYSKNSQTLILTNHLEEGDGEAALIYEFKVNEKGDIIFANFNIAG